MIHKTAIIMSGGGMRCSYGVGALLALIEKYNFKNPDIVIAGSGNAGTLSYFVAEQYSSIKNIWSNLLSTKKFINPLRISKIIDIDYLIDDVFKKQDILDEEKIYNSKMTYLIPAINSETGKIKYFSNRNKDNIFQAMRATKAMPIAFNKKVCINGKNYCDSYISTSTKLNALKAIECGADRLIIIDNDLPNFITELIFNVWRRLKNKKFRKNYLEYLRKIKETDFPNNVQLIYLKPKKKLRITTLNNSQKRLEASIQQGFDETCEDISLKEFLAAE
jgi:predicted patatin/cPLA2 family phospholipase